MARLPQYCTDRNERNVPENPTPAQAPWVAKMGSAFWAIHHYCWALINANRAEAAGLSPQLRRHLYRWAINDSYYVIKVAAPDFVLLPEIFLRVGQYHVALAEPVEAQDAFNKSRELKPDYWPAYQQLANLNLSLGRRQAAIEVLKEGLERIPGQPALTASLQRISAPGTLQAGRNTPPPKP